MSHKFIYNVSRVKQTAVLCVIALRPFSTSCPPLDSFATSLMIYPPTLFHELGDRLAKC